MQKLDRLVWAVEGWYEVEGYRFGIRSTSRAFGEWVDECLASHRVEGPEGEDDYPRWAAVVEDGGHDAGRPGKRYHILYRGTWDIVRTLDIRDFARAFLLELESLLFPTRDDAIYLEAGLMALGGTSVLLPSYMVPALARAGRRAQRQAFALPGTMAVAVDPATGHLVPVRSELCDLDAVEELLSRVPGNGRDPRVLVDEETTVDAVVTFGAGTETGVWPASRAGTLLSLASSVRNLPEVGGRAVDGLGRLVERAACYSVRWSSTEEMLRSLAAVADRAEPEREPWRFDD